ARPWIANLDENTFEIYINDAGHIRKSRMYDILFSGGSFEWWLGYAEEYPGGDLTVEDFRTRDDLWKFSMYARNIMNTMPFWEMRPADELVTGEDVNETYGGAEVFVKDTSVYAVYLPQAVNNGNLDLTGAP